MTRYIPESECPGAVPLADRPDTIPGPPGFPEDLRDTLPPGDEHALPAAQDVGIDTATNREMLALVITGLEQVRRTTERTLDLVLAQHEAHRRNEARLAALERDRFRGSRLPLMLAAAALTVSLLSVGVSAVQGWAIVASTSRMAP